MKHILTALFCTILFACNNTTTTGKSAEPSSSSTTDASSNSSGHWEGSFSNGMKGAKISFDISDDGKELRELTFQGYWRCDGSLDLTTLGRKKVFLFKTIKWTV
jgi:hypothetical protein